LVAEVLLARVGGVEGGGWSRHGGDRAGDLAAAARRLGFFFLWNLGIGILVLCSVECGFLGFMFTKEFGDRG
jgi:hypothetical protein